MLQHRIFDTITAITALILGMVLMAAPALAMRAPDPAGGAAVASYTLPAAPPLQKTAAAVSESTLTPTLTALIALIALLAGIAVTAILTRASTRRHRTNPA